MCIFSNILKDDFKVKLSDHEYEGTELFGQWESEINAWSDQMDIYYVSVNAWLKYPSG